VSGAFWGLKMKKFLLLFFVPFFVFADWTPSGLSGTTVKIIAVDPSNENIIYADCYSYLYKSTDAGASWTQLGAGTIASVNDVKVKSDGTVYMTGYINSIIGLYRSTNGGTTWTLLNGSFSGKIALASTNTILVMSSTSSGTLMKSTDGGSLWSSINLPSSPVYDLKCAGSTLYATYWHGCVKSNDLGTTLITIGADSVGGFPTHLHYGKIAITGSNIFITNVDSTGFYTDATQGIFFYDSTSGLWFDKSSGLLNKLATSVSFISPNILYVGTTGGGISKSINSGVSWTQDVAGLTDYNINVFETSSSAIYAGTNSGIFKTVLSNALPPAPENTITVKPINNLFNPEKSET